MVLTMNVYIPTLTFVEIYLCINIHSTSSPEQICSILSKTNVLYYASFVCTEVRENVVIINPTRDIPFRIKSKLKHILFWLIVDRLSCLICFNLEKYLFPLQLLINKFVNIHVRRQTLCG